MSALMRTRLELLLKAARAAEALLADADDREELTDSDRRYVLKPLRRVLALYEKVQP